MKTFLICVSSVLICGSVLADPLFPKNGFTTNAPGADINATGSSITNAARLQATRDVIAGGVSLTNLNTRFTGYTNSLELVLSNSAWNTAQSQLALSNANRAALTWTTNRITAHDGTNSVFEGRIAALETNTPALTNGFATVTELNAATNAAWTATTNRITGDTNRLWTAVTNLISEIPGGTATNAIVTIVHAGSNTTVSVSSSGLTNTYTVNANPPDLSGLATTGSLIITSNGVWTATTNLVQTFSNNIVALIPAGGGGETNFIGSTNGSGYGTTLENSPRISSEFFTAPGDVTLTPDEPGFYVFTNTQSRVVGWGSGSIDLTPPNTLTNPVQIAAGGHHSIALTAGGGVVSWGDDSWGQLINAPASHSYAAVAAGYNHSVLLVTNGTMYVRGFNDGLPQYMVAGIAAIAASPAVDGVAAISTNGTLRLFSRNTPGATQSRWGEDSAPGGATNLIAVSSGGEHGLALRADHSLYAWGNNTYGQASVPTAVSGTNLAAIAAGHTFSVALKNDGTVFAWGNNSSGATNVPGGLTDVVAISAGKYSAAAVRSNGTLLVWGGSLTNAAASNDVTAVALGIWHALAIGTHTNGQTLPDNISPTIIGYHGTNYPGRQGHNYFHGTNHFSGPLLDAAGNPIGGGWNTNADGTASFNTNVTVAGWIASAFGFKSGETNLWWPDGFTGQAYTPIQVWTSLGFGARVHSDQAVAGYFSSANSLAGKFVQANWTAELGTSEPVIRIWRQPSNSHANHSPVLELVDQGGDNDGDFLKITGVNGDVSRIDRDMGLRGINKFDVRDIISWQTNKAFFGLTGPDNAEFGVNIAANGGAGPNTGTDGVMMYLDTRTSGAIEGTAKVAFLIRQAGGDAKWPLTVHRDFSTHGVDGKLGMSANGHLFQKDDNDSTVYYLHLNSGTPTWTTSD